MWSRRKYVGGEAYIDLHAAAGGVEVGSYNRLWNAQVLRGLEELHQVKRHQLSIDEAVALTLPVGDDVTPHEWERMELRALEVHQPTFFSDVWDPWRAKLMATSYDALQTMRAAIEPGAFVCTLVANAYSPGSRIRERFGAAANFIQPLDRCGRCPGCRTAGIAPACEPPPRVPSRWLAAEGVTAQLTDLLAACPTADNVAVLVSVAPTEDAARLAGEFAKAGVRLFAGLESGLAPTSLAWWFVDGAGATPFELPPVPALVVPGEAAVGQEWLVATLRPVGDDGRPIPVVLVVKPGTAIGAKLRAIELLPHLGIEAAVARLRTKLWTT